MTRDDAVSTVQAVRDEMRDAGLFDPLTPEGELHQSVLGRLMSHFDNHIATNTEPARCCERITDDEASAWAAVIRAEWGGTAP